MSSSKRWMSASATELPGRSPLPASALSPVRQSVRRSVSRPDRDPAPVVPSAAASIARTLWPSSSSSGKNKTPRAPSPLSSAPAPPPPPAPSSGATLADHLAKEDDGPRALSRQRSCTELPRFADADAEARKIGKPSGKGGGGGHAFGRSMRFLPSTKPAGVTLTPGRVAPSDLRRLANNAASLDAAADIASSGSECSDASRGSATPRAAASKPRSPLLPRTGSVRLLGSSNTQWALSPGRRSGSPLKTAALPTVPESKGKKSLISLGWGHIFHRRKHAAEDASIAAVTASLLSSPVSRSGAGGHGEVGYQMRMAHCRLLQWRFANAKAEDVRKRKLGSAELELMGTWASVSEMRGKVARKRVQLEKEKRKIKLNTVLSFQVQMKGLEQWGKLETEHASALSSTIGYARAAVCRLPLTSGAKVSLPPLATILQQAQELTRTTKTMTRSFVPMAQDTSLLISELVHVAIQEQAMLHECIDLLNQVSALQVEEQSLRCHLVQSSSSLGAVVTVK